MTKVEVKNGNVDNALKRFKIKVIKNEYFLIIF